ncbi:hypothetical protein FB107DRAFT_280245 [Schizophyllum commune]
MAASPPPATPAPSPVLPLSNALPAPSTQPGAPSTPSGAPSTPSGRIRLDPCVWAFALAGTTGRTPDATAPCKLRGAVASLD